MRYSTILEGLLNENGLSRVDAGYAMNRIKNPKHGYGCGGRWQGIMSKAPSTLNITSPKHRRITCTARHHRRHLIWIQRGMKLLASTTRKNFYRSTTLIQTHGYLLESGDCCTSSAIFDHSVTHHHHTAVVSLLYGQIHMLLVLAFHQHSGRQSHQELSTDKAFAPLE